jgi:hypothetical protein
MMRKRSPISLASKLFLALAVLVAGYVGAHLTLERYFRWTKERNYAISPATRQAIRANLALCAKDVGRKEIVQGVAQEFMFVRQQDIDELSQSLNALEP